MNGSETLLCKDAFFGRFIQVVCEGGNPAWRTLVHERSANGCVSYASMKQAAQGFCDARRQFESALAKAKLGYWLRKPLEQNCFEKRLLDAAPVADDNRSRVDVVTVECGTNVAANVGYADGYLHAGSQGNCGLVLKMED